MTKIKSKELKHMAVVGGEQLKLEGVDPKVHTGVQRSWTFNPITAVTMKQSQLARTAQMTETCDSLPPQ